MNNHHFNELILKRIDRNFDRIMPFGALIALLSALVIMYSTIPVYFAIVDVVIGLVFFVMYFLRGRFSTEFKIIVTICIPILLGLLTFTDGGFYSGTTPLILTSNTIAVLFLSKKNSVLTAVLSISSLAFLMAYTVAFHEDSIREPIGAWVIQLMLIVLFVVILHVAVYAIRKYLLENIAELNEAVDTTYRLAFYDRLTGLPNLNQFRKEMDRRSSEKPLNGYLVMFTIKTLNEINAVYGVDMGDRVLAETARCLHYLMESRSVLARVGGNEFLVWIDRQDWNDMDRNLQSVLAEFRRLFTIDEVERRVGTDMAYTVFDSDRESFDAAYQKLNLAMTVSKQQEDVVMVGYKAEFEEQLQRMSAIKQALAKAMDNRDFKVFYQQKVDGRDGRVIGVEALARWKSECFGYVSPGEFIPMIESLGHAVRFGQIITEKVLKDVSKLADIYGNGIKVSINISPTFLMSEDFVTFMQTRTSIYLVCPTSIMLEITEDVVITGLSAVGERLKKLRSLGFGISLDDFGSGYSSLNYLSALDVDEIKIDKALVDHLEDNDRSSIMLETIIHLANQYEIALVAEGVESKSQEIKLLAAGCHIIQGFLYSKPLPISRT